MPYSRRRREIEPYDHGQLIHRAHFGFVAAAAAVIMASIGLSVTRMETHALVYELFGQGELQTEQPPWPADLPIHHVTVTEADIILWDGIPVTDAELADTLRAAASAPERPGIVFEAQPLAGYELSLRVLGIIRNSGIAEDRFRLDGLDRHGEFGRE